MDIAEIGIGVDTSDLKLAKTDLQAIDDAFNTAERSASVFVQAFSRATARAVKDAEIIRKSSQAFVTLVNSANNVTNSYKSAEASAEAFTNELRKQEAQAVRTAQANQNAINKQLNVNQGNATSNGAGFGALEGEIERLAQKYNQVYASSRLYESSLNELNRAHQVGVLNTNQHAAAIESLNLEYQTFQSGAVVGMNRFANAAQQTAGRTNQLGVVVQQTGYQVGDFLVQVQSGQNWMVAFGQQATQLVGVLPLLSTSLGMSVGSLIALSTGLGIAIPLITALGAIWMRSGEQTDKATESVKAFDEALKAVAATAEQIRIGGVAEALGVSKEVATLGERIIEKELQRKQILQDIDTIQANAIVQQGMFDLSAAFGLYQTQNKKIALQENLALADKELENLRSQVEVIARTNAALSIQAGYYRNLGDLESSRVAKLAAFHSGMMAVNNAALSAAARARELDKELGEGAASALKLAGIDIAGPLSAGAAQAGAIAANLGVAYNQAVALQGVFNRLNSGSDERGSQSKTVAGANNFIPNQPWMEGYSGGGRNAINSGGGGGSSTEDKLESELEAIRQSSAAKAELEIEEYEKRQETLRSALEAKMITLTEYNALEVQIAKDHAAALTEIDTYRYGTALDKAGKWFGEMATAAQGGGEKLMRISKVFGAAEALINAYRAFNQVIATPGVPFWQKIPAGLSVLAAGMGMVNAIKGVGAGSSGSSGAGGGRGSASVSGGNAPEAPQRVLVQGINPDDIFTGQWLSNFFDNFYKENSDRGAVFMVNR